jgi:hypothetical protein
MEIVSWVFSLFRLNEKVFLYFTQLIVVVHVVPNKTKLLDFQYLLANYVVTVILQINEFGIEQIHKRCLIECKL